MDVEDDRLNVRVYLPNKEDTPVEFLLIPQFHRISLWRVPLSPTDQKDVTSVP